MLAEAKIEERKKEQPLPCKDILRKLGVEAKYYKDKKEITDKFKAFVNKANALLDPTSSVNEAKKEVQLKFVEFLKVARYVLPRELAQPVSLAKKLCDKSLHVQSRVRSMIKRGSWSLLSQLEKYVCPTAIIIPAEWLSTFDVIAHADRIFQSKKPWSKAAKVKKVLEIFSMMVANTYSSQERLSQLHEMENKERETKRLEGKNESDQGMQYPSSPIVIEIKAPSTQIENPKQKIADEKIKEYKVRLMQELKQTLENETLLEKYRNPNVEERKDSKLGPTSEKAQWSNPQISDCGNFSKWVCHKMGMSGSWFIKADEVWYASKGQNGGWTLLHEPSDIIIATFDKPERKTDEEEVFKREGQPTSSSSNSSNSSSSTPVLSDKIETGKKTDESYKDGTQAFKPQKKSLWDEWEWHQLLALLALCLLISAVAVSVIASVAPWLLYLPIVATILSYGTLGTIGGMAAGTVAVAVILVGLFLLSWSVMHGIQAYREASRQADYKKMNLDVGMSAQRPSSQLSPAPVSKVPVTTDRIGEGLRSGTRCQRYRIFYKLRINGCEGVFGNS